MMKLTTEQIGDHRIDIHVNEGGKFTATFEDHDYRADTKDELIEDLRQAARKMKAQVAIPITMVDTVPASATNSRNFSDDPYVRGTGVVQCVFRGVHPRTGALLLADLDGKKFQLSSYEGKRNVAKRLTPDEEARYLELANALLVAQTAKDDFLETILLDPKKLQADAKATT